MKGGDWGKLIARLFAVLLVHDAVSVYLAIWTGAPLPIGYGDRAFSELPPLVSLSTAVVVWIFAGQFMPKPEADVAPSDQSFAATVVVAAVASYLFLTYCYGFLDGFFVRREQDAVERETATMLAMFFDLAVSVACALVVVNSRRVTSWVVR